MSELANLTLPELLARLQDIAEPEPVSYLPQTAAWYAFGTIFVLLLLLALWRLILRHRARLYRREALAALAELEQQTAVDGDQVMQLAALLRRTALTAYSQEKVASLHGEDWLVFLDERYGGKGFSIGPGRMISEAPYGRVNVLSQADRVALIREVRAWIRKHEADIAHA